MLDIKFIRENPDAVKENIRKKFQNAKLPLVGMLIGGIDLGQLDIVLKPAVMNGDEVVTAAVTLGIGTFLTTIIDFILVALVIFLMIKAINRFHKKKEEAPAPEEPKGPTSEELLTEIRDLLKEKNQ